MSDMPEIIHAEGDFDYGSYYGGDQGDTTPYTRSDLVPTWNRDMSAAPAGESVLLATTGGRVGEAYAPMAPGGMWFWRNIPARMVINTPIAWQPLPRHPDEESGE